jgi:4-hydroxybutyrate dehydrogenase
MLHYIETLFSPRYIVLAEAIAFEGTGRIWRHLERGHGRDMAARTEMMMAASKAA